MKRQDGAIDVAYINMLVTCMAYYNKIFFWTLQRANIEGHGQDIGISLDLPLYTHVDKYFTLRKRRELRIPIPVVLTYWHSTRVTHK